ncbi:hypothetical protein F5Y04DRAFT_278209 [Hypomontagnella monticulosa]|nr:hypothetical protein F5Y04DRAFT_278209 [Hypomontagnella monticulosa]
MSFQEDISKLMMLAYAARIAAARDQLYRDAGTQTNPTEGDDFAKTEDKSAELDNDNDMPAPAPVPAIMHSKARGHIDEAGLFVCECGSKMANKAKNIASHLSIKHNDQAAYVKKHSVSPHKCYRCLKEFQHFCAFEAHIRNSYDFRGSTEQIWKDWQETEEGTIITFPNTN